MSDERNYVAGLNQMLSGFRQHCNLIGKTMPALIRFSPSFYQNLKKQLDEIHYEDKDGEIYGIPYEIEPKYEGKECDAQLFEERPKY